MRYRLKDGVNFKFVNDKSVMKYDFDLENYYNNETRLFDTPKDYVAFSLMGQVFVDFLIPLDLVEKVENDE